MHPQCNPNTTKHQLEEAAPEALQRHLESLHAAALPDNPSGPFSNLAQAADKGDTAALHAILAAARPALDRLNSLLDEAGAAAGTLDRAALSASAAGFLLQHQRTKMALDAVAAAAAAESDDGSGGGRAAAVQGAVDPVELMDLVEVLRVFQPGGPGLLSTAGDALNYTADRHGPGSKQAQAALQLFLKMLLCKYGEVASRPVLERLVDGVTRSAPRLAAMGLDAGFAMAGQSGGS